MSIKKTEMAFFVEPLEQRIMLSSSVVGTLVWGDGLWLWEDEFDYDLLPEAGGDSTALVGNIVLTVDGATNQFVGTTNPLSVSYDLNKAATEIEPHPNSQ